ncbi:MAG TPA: transglycosylase domain-containing protein [Anaerolineae bacterium]|nr:transglycosylase domain-containing protein [Anaerolineae bacterium]
MNNDPRIPIILNRRERKHAKQGKGRTFLRVAGIALISIVVAIVSFFGLTVGGAVAAYLSLTADLPDPSQLEAKFTNQNQDFFETTKIYDRTGKNLLYEVIDERTGDRQWVTLDQIPQQCRQAVISDEDRSFYENAGFDLRGMARALMSNLQGNQVQGGSSITQQVVKNNLIEEDQRTVRTGAEGYLRKLRETLLAIEVGRRYPKDQILEWYLNTNNYGNFAYGIQAAAKVYFNKTVDQLDLAECAMLAPIPQFPIQNPIDSPNDATLRQGLALDAMARDGYITADEAAAAEQEKLQIKTGGVAQRFNVQAPHFSVYVRKWLENNPAIGPDLVNRGGLKVYTTLDLDLQNFAQKAIADQVKTLTAQGHNANNGAAVVIRPTTGEILAMVGSADYWNDAIDGKFNVTTGLRQPGSSFKPFTYLTLLTQGVSPSYGFLDVRTEFAQPGANPPIYVPEDYDRKYHGYQRMRLALAQSLNIPAVEALQMAGVDNVIRTAHKMGITTLDRGLDYYGLALTLGGGEVKLLDQTYAFGVLANRGNMAGAPIPEDQQRPGYRTVDPVPVLRVEDSDGKVLWEYDSPTVVPIVDEKYAYILTNFLSDNPARWPAFGAHNVLELDRPAAVKTGTTNDYKDNWTVGYTPQVVTGVWIGNTDNSAMKHVTGISGAAPVWNQIMTYFLKDKPVEPFVRPPGLEEKAVCATTGMLPTKYCPSVTELFVPGTEPTSYDTVYQAFLIDRETGQLATANTPPDKVEEKVFEIYPPEAADYVKEANIPQPPTAYDTNYGPPPNAFGDVAIIQPGTYSYIHAVTPIIGNTRGGDFNHYRLDFGKGLSPTEWQQIGPDHNNQVDNNVLENFDTTTLDGLYSLRLTVFRNNGDIQTAVVPVTVDNITPTIKIIYPNEGDTYSYPDDEWVSIQVDVSDNVAIDRVEMYVDDKPDPWAIHNAPPYGEKWKLDGADKLGTHTFFARVYDKAGNMAESNKVKVFIGVKKQ